jgi:hypothetical protein
MVTEEIVVQTYVIGPAIVMGVLIGLIEVVFVHSDEAGMGWFTHALHALPFTLFFVFASMNISFVIGWLNLAITANWYVEFGIRAVIGIIAMMKIAGAAAIAGKVGERWYHTLILGIIIILAPYAWELVAPMVGPMLPIWLQ